MLCRAFIQYFSEDIHGSPWTSNAAQFSDKLNSVDRQFLEALYKEMGLISAELAVT
jgi:hypothetical protein